jgi:uncharacterized repeat protein (TIGR03803 family)
LKTHQATVVYGFSTSAGNSVVADGLVQGQDGNFYGATSQLSGLQYIWGAVFQVTPGGQATLSQFPPLLATGPMVQTSSGAFYGVGGFFDSGGTTSPGLVFSYTPSPGAGILHLFGQTTTDGAFPAGTVVQGPNGDLYGVTTRGGTAGLGIIFEISTLGNYTILHNFGDGSVPNDGLNPAGTLIVGQDGNLYGTTKNGGSAGLGTVFKFSLTP